MESNKTTTEMLAIVVENFKHSLRKHHSASGTDRDYHQACAYEAVLRAFGVSKAEIEAINVEILHG